MVIKTIEEFERIKNSSLLVGKTLGVVAQFLKPGIETKVLDQLAEEFIRDNGGTPAFKGYSGFPSTLCISINEQVVHGIPGNYQIREGDVVSVDCGAVIDGYYGDYAYTFIVGEVSPDVRKLVEVTKESLYKGIEVAIAGNRTGDIGFAVQLHVERQGFSVVRDLVGHGIGTHLHESPQVPNYGKRGYGSLLTENMVICIEPMINLGTHQVVQSKDGWTISTKDKKVSAHFEHMVLVGKEKPQIVSTYEFIEKNWKQ